MPLGASMGPAGLAVMPYDVTFDGGFFNAAANLARYDVAVIRPNRFIRAVKAA